MNMLDLIQWPAMAVTVLAAWFVGSSQPTRRKIGFWLYLVGNVLWVAWAIPTHAYALLALQFCLAIMNIRGQRKNAEQESNAAPAEGSSKS
jgi:hypothetical protein